MFIIGQNDYSFNTLDTECLLFPVIFLFIVIKKLINIFKYVKHMKFRYNLYYLLR